MPVVDVLQALAPVLSGLLAGEEPIPRVSLS